MFKKLCFDEKKVYPTLVISTMSSGKSTLINALVGKELLPSRNTACTAKALAIIDNDEKSGFSIHAIDKNGKYTFIEKATKEIIDTFNETNEVLEMILEGEIKGIRNSKKSLMLIDTPGINNSMDQSHAQITKSVLKEYQEGLLLYIINAQQVGTYDDGTFLSFIAKRLEENQNFKIIFIINKMDIIDPEVENPREFVNMCKEYIEDKGINDPIIIPVSASNALLFKKVLNKDSLSMIEQFNFEFGFSIFKRESYSLTDYVYIPNEVDRDDCLFVNGISYTNSSIYAALENTGLPLLERKIDEILIKSSKKKAPKIMEKNVHNIVLKKSKKRRSRSSKRKGK